MVSAYGLGLDSDDSDLMQTVSWIPMDAVAGTLVDAALSESALSPSHNLVHPRPVPWSQVIANVQRSIEITLQRKFPIVPFSQWFEQLDAIAHKSDVDVQNIVSRPFSLTLMLLISFGSPA